MPPGDTRTSHLWVAASILLADYLLAFAAPDAGYSLRAAAALGIWYAGVRWVPLRHAGDFPTWGRTLRSLRLFARVSLLVGLALGIPALAVLFVCGRPCVEWAGAPFAIDAPHEAGSFLLAGGLAAPLAEEFIYRGALYPRLRAAAGVSFAIVVSGLAFWGVHWVFHQGPTPVHHLLAGCLLAWARERTGSLLAPTLLHAAGNMTLLLADVAWFRWSGLAAGVPG